MKTVDVTVAEATGTDIGLSTVNKAAHGFFGQSELWYEITEILGYAAIALAALFFVIALVQLIRRRSLFKVDRALIALGVLYVVMAAVYLLFELVIINYRPIIMPDSGTIEASFPSSHTMISVVIFGSGAVLVPRFIKNRVLAGCLQAVLVILIILTETGRLLSGVHWLTDIVGGLLIGGALLAAFCGVLRLIDEKQENTDTAEMKAEKDA